MNLKNIYRLYNTTRYFKVKFILIFFVVGKRMKNKKKNHSEYCTLYRWCVCGDEIFEICGFEINRIEAE